MFQGNKIQQFSFKNKTVESRSVVLTFLLLTYQKLILAISSFPLFFKLSYSLGECISMLFITQH